MGKVEELLSKVDFDKLTGGDLSDRKVRQELNKVLRILQEVCEKYRTLDTLKPNKLPNGETQYLAVSGEPIQVLYDYMHQGIALEGLNKVAVGIRVGMGLENGMSEAIIKVSEMILSKYSFTNNSYIFVHNTFRGTNYSTVALSSRI